MTNDQILPLHTKCPETGALVFHKTAFQLEQEKLQQEAAEAKAKADKTESENAGLKALLGAIVDAMPAAQRAKLPDDLVALVKSGDEPQA